MKNWQKLLIGMVLFNQLAFTVMVFYFDFFSLAYNYSHVGFIALLLLFVNAIYLLSKPHASLRFFSLMIILIGWSFLLHMSALEWLQLLSRLLATSVPILLFIFFCLWCQFEQSALYRRFLLIQWLAWGLTGALLFISDEVFDTARFLQLFFAMLCCLFLFAKGRNTKKNQDRHQGLILLSIFISFTPYIALSLYTPPSLPSDFRITALYACMAMPLAIFYSLCKGWRFQSGVPIWIIWKKGLFYGTSLCVLLFLNGFLLSLRAWQIYLLFLLLANYLYYLSLLKEHLDRELLRTRYFGSRPFYKEKLELIASLEDDNFLLPYSRFLSQLVEQSLNVNGYMILRREGGRLQFYEGMGCFKGWRPSQRELDRIDPGLETIRLAKKEYPVFPLSCKGRDYGLLVLAYPDGIFPLHHGARVLDLVELVGSFFHWMEVIQVTKKEYASLSHVKYDEFLNLKTYQEVQTLERKVSIYLHDDILQSVLALRNLAGHLDTRQKDLKDLILDSLNDLAHSIRETTFDFYPSGLESLGLYQCLVGLFEKVRVECPFEQRPEIIFEADPVLTAGPITSYFLFRSVKELVQNAVKHSGCQKIKVSLSGFHDLYSLTVTDDGKGFDARSLDHSFRLGHFGLMSVKQEVNTLQGKMSIKSSKEAGTRINVWVPDHDKGGSAYEVDADRRS